MFHFSQEVGPGIPLLTPTGAMMRHITEEYVRETQTRYGYEHVWTGNLVKESLYNKSGHLENYANALYSPMIKDAEHGQVYRLKPMNCPSHMTLYHEMGIHSYREFPLRFAELCTLYRFEKAGELNGMTRVRALTQDDCHIFCTPDQIEGEFSLALQLIRAEDGQRHTPVLIHRAVTGSWERFYGMLIEYYAGAFPVWLAPIQAAIIPITDRHVEYAREVERTLKAAGIRTPLDLGDARMNAKIRDAQLQNIPYMLVIGDQEQKAGAVAGWLRNNQNLGALAVADLVARIHEKVRTKDKEI